MINYTKRFLKKESFSGILLIGITIFVLALSNSSLASFYNFILNIPIEIRIGDYSLNKHLYHWVNDGLMSIFFLLIGLEVKREVIKGELSSWPKAVLPVFAAIGGVVVPAIIYLGFNYSNANALNGWAIPTATDVAFALAIFTLLKGKVPSSLKIFLLSLAIIDDLSAIVIIALFYTSDLSGISILVSTLCVLILISLNYLKVARKMAYILVGLVLWVSVLKSGVHATLAGVILAFCIPISQQTSEGKTIKVSESFEEDLQYWVDFLILPLFVFVNAGVTIKDIPLENMLSSPALGIIFGLFLGKQIGVFCFSWLAIKLGMAALPNQCNWRQLYGVSVLTGIGFTMSLFLSSLAFPDSGAYQQVNKLAILVGSFLSGVIGYLILLKSSKVN